MDVSPVKIGIIGSGIIGLSTATILQSRYPNALVEITTSDFYYNTTSNGAAGYCLLKYSNTSGNSKEKVKKWNKEGLEHYLKLYRSPDAVKAGILVEPVYLLSDRPIDIESDMYDFYPNYRHVNKKELQLLGFPSKMPYVACLTSALVEGRYYLPYLLDQFKQSGGKIIKRTLEAGSRHTIADWAVENKYDVIVNCSGLGSRNLFSDPTVIPIRGQVARVKAPWFKYSFTTVMASAEFDNTYAFSCRESVVIGGTRQKSDWDLSIRSSEFDDIFSRISEYNTCLSKSTVIEQWCGLRPFRPKLRLEIDNIWSSCGVRIPVVHNYGHGPSGIGMARGTSMEACDLVDEVLSKVRPRL